MANSELRLPILACVMATVPANELLRRTFMANQDDPRMPAILEDGDWDAWLGQREVTSDEAKALLKTMEGVSWRVEPEPKKQRGETKSSAS